MSPHKRILIGTASGSETDWAERKRIQRQTKESLQIESSNTMDNVQDNVRENVRENVHEILEIDIRDRDRDINLNSDKTEKKEKHKYGEYKNVLLSDDEYKKFLDEYGEEKTMGFINHYSELKEMKGYKYKSDYLALKKWGIQSYEESQRKNRNGQNQGCLGPRVNLDNKIMLEESL